MTTATGPETSWPRRVPVSAAVRQSVTFAWRSILQIKHKPAELLDLSVQPVMFTLLFTYVFGGAIGGTPHDYLQFALGGLIVQNALFLSIYAAIGLSADLKQGLFDRFRSLPIARGAPLAGRVLADVVRQLWSLIVLLIVGVVLGFRLTTGLASLLGAFAVLTMFTVAFAWLPVWLGVLARDPEKVQVFGFVVVLPLTFTSNALVPLDTMPPWLRSWVSVNPVTQVNDTLRALLSGGPVGGPLTATVLWSAAFAAVFGTFSVRALRSRV
ncbi:ABC transporter permease [Amycolatopsis sp. QT-25]|uniref:ABC transporter permease n=1 Tax=Amycolatopsis sp. QT-25 TaxID=3034022 RepID=UPI0023EA9FBD|nr:ABC transporter permease [Amycolatopsis sp. QT-25]WET76800.1 ABC transporter permease [Amycolatopsis sp. QT-25]